MKKHLLIILICASVKIQAQQTTFTKVYYDAQQIGIEEHAIVRANDNGYMVAGRESYNNGYILKLDSAGNFLWNKTYNISTSNEFNCIASTNDTCFIVGGEVYNQSTTHNDALFAKLDAGGDTLWTRTISVTGYSITVLSIQQTNDSGYIMTGSASANVTPYTKIFIAKTDFTGTLEWVKVITGANYENIGNSVKQDADSNFVILGYLENNGPPFELSAFLLKMSQSGSVLWTQKYFLAAQQIFRGYDFELTNNGIVCYLDANGYVALMKTDFSGNIIWSKSYNNSSVGSFSNIIPQIHLNSDSGFVFVSGSCSGGFITKTDSGGNLTWVDNLALGSMDAVETNNKEFFISGNGPLCGVTPQVLSPQIGIIQTDSLGSVQNCVFPYFITPVVLSVNIAAITVTLSGGGIENTMQPIIDTLTLVSDSGCVDTYGGIGVNRFSNDIVIFPNPSSGILTLATSKRKQAVLTIIDIFGEEIYKAEMNDVKTTIDLSSYSKGIYFCRLVSKNENFETGKIVIIK
jgi:hypothetical protein